MTELFYDVTYLGQHKSPVGVVISIATSAERAMGYVNDHSEAERVIQEFVREVHSSTSLLTCEAMTEEQVLLWQQQRHAQQQKEAKSV